jgi:hypothetical protein
MRGAKLWLCVASVTAALTGWTLLSATLSPAGAATDARAPKDHWHHHDGHWSYWDDSDHRWYYTDGTHWFYDDNAAWKVYRFDKHYGREGFERGDYKLPGQDARIVVPRHQHPQ